jgi:hypothetical protein
MTIQTHPWLVRGRSSRLWEGLGGSGAGAGGIVTVVLGVPEPLGEPGALGEFGVLGGLSGNVKFLFSGLDLEPFEPCYRRCVQI